MIWPLIVREQAEFDLDETRDWYEDQQADLGEQFLTAVEEALLKIRAAPELWAAGYKGVRRVLLSRFPYIIYFRLLPTRIEVLAILHGSRDPRQWRERA